MHAGASLQERSKGMEARDGRSEVPPYMPLRLAADSMKQRSVLLCISCPPKAPPKHQPLLEAPDNVDPRNRGWVRGRKKDERGTKGQLASGGTLAIGGGGLDSVQDLKKMPLNFLNNP